jgi:hypothetical protein
MADNENTNKRLNNQIDAALWNLQADGTVDRGGIADLLRQLRDKVINDPMTRCLGFTYEMKEVKSWPTWLCDYSVVQQATNKGWIIEVRKEPFIPRWGQSFIISGLSDEGRAEFLRRIPTINAPTINEDRRNQKLGALTIGETERLLGSEPSFHIGADLKMVAEAQERIQQYGRATFDHIIHNHTDQCGFDRNASHTEDTYVCTCGWRAVPKQKDNV